MAARRWQRGGSTQRGLGGGGGQCGSRVAAMAVEGVLLQWRIAVAAAAQQQGGGGSTGTATVVRQRQWQHGGDSDSATAGRQ